MGNRRLVASVVNVAGRPLQVGGTVARPFGWMVLVGGVLVALVVAALLQALFPAGFAGWAMGFAVALVSVMVGVPMIAAGRRLQNKGKGIEQQALERAVFALAARRGGTLGSPEVARALGISAPHAEEVLTELARQADGRVELEIDPDGHLVFLFPELRPLRVAPAEGTRVASRTMEDEEEEEAALAPALRRAPSARPPR